MRGWRAMAGVGVVLAGALGLGVSPAGADATATASLAQSTIAPGATTTGTIAITYGTGIIAELDFRLVPVGSTTGTVTLARTSSSGAVHACVDIDATEFDCLWSDAANPPTGAVAVSLTASADAAGTWRLEAVEQWAAQDGGQIVVTTMASADLVVAAAPTTTVTGGSGGVLPPTGRNGTVLWLAGAALGIGVAAAGVARRARTATGS